MDDLGMTEVFLLIWAIDGMLKKNLCPSDMAAYEGLKKKLQISYKGKQIREVMRVKIEGIEG